MTHEAFIAGYERVRQLDDGEALGRLWHADGWLHHPNLNRSLRGWQLPAFNDLVLERLPDLRWELLEWATRAEFVFLEWTCRATVGDRLLAWSGVDRMIVRDGRIAEQIVYCDTMPLWAGPDSSMTRAADHETTPLRAALDSSMARAALVDADVLLRR